MAITGGQSVPDLATGYTPGASDRGGCRSPIARSQPAPMRKHDIRVQATRARALTSPSRAAASGSGRTKHRRSHTRRLVGDHPAPHSRNEIPHDHAAVTLDAEIDRRVTRSADTTTYPQLPSPAAAQAFTTTDQKGTVR
jgi:hypothetical protein